MLTTLLQDLRYSARLMSRARGFTTAALLTLALAIGANTAVFSVVYGVLLRPLPYPGADRIVRLSEEHPGGQAIVRQAMLSHLTFDAWSANPQTVEALAAYTTATVTVTSFTEPVRIETGSVSPSLFQMLGVTPLLGRTFRTGESTMGADRVALLSHRLWQSRFGSDPAIVGKPVSLNGQPYEIVGVLPGWFYFPDRDAALWTPFVPEPGRPDGVRLLYVIARLTPGATVEQAAAEGTAAARSVKRPMAADLLFGKGGPVEVRARVLTDEITRGVRPAMRVLMMAVGTRAADCLRQRGEPASRAWCRPGARDGRARCARGGRRKTGAAAADRERCAEPGRRCARGSSCVDADARGAVLGAGGVSSYRRRAPRLARARLRRADLNRGRGNRGAFSRVAGGSHRAHGVAPQRRQSQRRRRRARSWSAPRDRGGAERRAADRRRAPRSQLRGA